MRASSCDVECALLNERVFNHSKCDFISTDHSHPEWTLLTQSHSSSLSSIRSNQYLIIAIYVVKVRRKIYKYIHICVRVCVYGHVALVEGPRRNANKRIYTLCMPITYEKHFDVQIYAYMAASTMCYHFKTPQIEHFFIFSKLLQKFRHIQYDRLWLR